MVVRVRDCFDSIRRLMRGDYYIGMQRMCGLGLDPC